MLKGIGWKSLGRRMRRWDDDIEMDLEQVKLDWIHLTQDRLWWMVPF
jgi:hypothetical protein